MIQWGVSTDRAAPWVHGAWVNLYVSLRSLLASCQPIIARSIHIENGRGMFAQNASILLHCGQFSITAPRISLHCEVRLRECEALPNTCAAGPPSWPRRRSSWALASATYSP